MPNHLKPVKIVESLAGVGAPTPKHESQLPPQLPSRVSRRGLPCPEEHDTPYTDWKEAHGGGWIKVDSKIVREARRGAPCLLED